MSKHILDEEAREAICNEYMVTRLPQNLYCEFLREKRGLELSPRTLRNWLRERQRRKLLASYEQRYSPDLQDLYEEVRAKLLEEFILTPRSSSSPATADRQPAGSPGPTLPSEAPTPPAAPSSSPPAPTLPIGNRGDTFDFDAEYQRQCEQDLL